MVKKIEKRSKSTDLDVTGSPLKASFSIDEEDNNDFEVITMARKPSGPSYLPISTREARFVILSVHKKSCEKYLDFVNF